jgi:hypothetical protein
MLGGADVDCPFGADELRPRFKQVERRPNLRCGRGFPGRLVMAAGKCTGANAPPVRREAEEDWGRLARHGAEASPHSR